MSDLAVEKRLIAERSIDLVPVVGTRARWVSEKLGVISLLNTGIKTKQPELCFELNWISRQNPETKTYLGRKFVYLGNGAIMGVLRSDFEHIPTTEEEEVRIKQAIQFQLENGLFAPHNDDYEHLAELLLAEREELQISND